MPQSLDDEDGPSELQSANGKEGFVPETVVAQQRLCFIISPIGPHGSDIRKRADDVRDYVIKPAVEPLRYRVRRADEIADPGMIMQQIVDTIVEADLVVADLTGLNPNVLYELAIRHELAKPVVTIAHIGTELPFDLKQVRAILFDHTDLKSANECVRQIHEQVVALQDPGHRPDNPILSAKRLKAWTESGDVNAARDVPIFEALNDIRATLSSMNNRLRKLEMRRDPDRYLGVVAGEVWDGRGEVREARSVPGTVDPAALGDSSMVELANRTLGTLIELRGKRPDLTDDLANVEQGIHRAMSTSDMAELIRLHNMVIAMNLELYRPSA